jgi:hypothetical protein
LASIKCIGTDFDEFIEATLEWNFTTNTFSIFGALEIGKNAIC